ncbi:hypothetical protein BD779DRAFT_1549641 [Infundibulicybe gibba]|nr:hypothetical protein BD779DRAFT_1549641 [Infundibulicybe gibba]
MLSLKYAQSSSRIRLQRRIHWYWGRITVAYPLYASRAYFRPRLRVRSPTRSSRARAKGPEAERASLAWGVCTSGAAGVPGAERRGLGSAGFVVAGLYQAARFNTYVYVRVRFIFLFCFGSVWGLVWVVVGWPLELALFRFVLPNPFQWVFGTD